MMPPRSVLQARNVAVHAAAETRVPESRFQPHFVGRFQESLAPLQTQRIWVLERRGPQRVTDDIRRYAGAVLVLRADAVYALIVRAPELARASDLPLREGRLRVCLERDAFKFPTLDAALDGMARARRVLLAQGWTEPAGS